MIKQLALGYVKDKIKGVCEIRKNINLELLINPKYKNTLDYAAKDLRMSLDDLKIELTIAVFNLSKSCEIECYRRVKNDY